MKTQNILLSAFVFAGAMTTASVAKADDSAQCRVTEVLAKKDGDGTVPRNLKFIESELKSDAFAAYKSFELLDAKDYKLELNVDKKQRTKSGHSLGLKLLGITNDKLKVNVSVFSAKQKKLLSTAYSIENKGLVLLAGYKHAEGKIIFAVQCQKR